MQSMSPVFLLDVKLLFTKSQISLRKASSKLNTLHRVLSDKVVTCLEKMENTSDPNEEEVTSAFGDVRMHTKSSKPYYYEEVYKRVSAAFIIPVDRSGCARLFTTRAELTETTQPHNSDCDDTKNIKSWHCNRDICNINTDMITGTVRLLRRISSTSANRCVSLYSDLNQCQNPNRTNCLGHPLDCTLDCNCTSLNAPSEVTFMPFSTAA